MLDWGSLFDVNRNIFRVSYNVSMYNVHAICEKKNCSIENRIRFCQITNLFAYASNRVLRSLSHSIIPCNKAENLPQIRKKNKQIIDRFLWKFIKRSYWTLPLFWLILSLVSPLAHHPSKHTHTSVVLSVRCAKYWPESPFVSMQHKLGKLFRLRHVRMFVICACLRTVYSSIFTLFGTCIWPNQSNDGSSMCVQRIPI